MKKKKNKIDNGRRKQQRQDLRGNMEWVNQQIMLTYQIMHHWGIIKISQEGEFLPLFDPKRNMPCAWLDSDAKCVNKECNWFPGQCIFTGMMKDCEFYMAMMDEPEEEYHTIKDEHPEAKPSTS